jgi:hypothetical protein
MKSLGPSEGFDPSQTSLFRQAERFKGCCLVRRSRHAQMLTLAFLGVDPKKKVNGSRSLPNLSLHFGWQQIERGADFALTRASVPRSPARSLEGRGRGPPKTEFGVYQRASGKYRRRKIPLVTKASCRAGWRMQ